MLDAFLSRSLRFPYASSTAGKEAHPGYGCGNPIRSGRVSQGEERCIEGLVNGTAGGLRRLAIEDILDAGV